MQWPYRRESMHETVWYDPLCLYILAAEEVEPGACRILLTSALLLAFYKHILRRHSHTRAHICTHVGFAYILIFIFSLSSYSFSFFPLRSFQPFHHIYSLVRPNNYSSHSSLHHFSPLHLPLLIQLVLKSKAFVSSFFSWNVLIGFPTFPGFDIKSSECELI